MLLELKDSNHLYSKNESSPNIMDVGHRVVENIIGDKFAVRSGSKQQKEMIL